MDIADHVAHLQSQFQLLVVMQSAIRIEMRVVINFFSTIGHCEHVRKTAFVSTWSNNAVKWGYLAFILVEKYKRFHRDAGHLSRATTDDCGCLASSSRKNTISARSKNGLTIGL